MRNCFKTQLKDSVQNDTLLKIGELVVSLLTTNNSEAALLLATVNDVDKIVIDTDKEVTINNTTNTHFEIANSAGFGIMFPNANEVYTIAITNKYKIRYIGNQSASKFKSFKVSGYLTSLDSIDLYYQGDEDIMIDIFNDSPLHNSTVINGGTNKKIKGNINPSIIANHSAGVFTLIGIDSKTDLSNVSMIPQLDTSWMHIENCGFIVNSIGSLINGAHISNFIVNGSPNISGDLSDAGMANVKRISGFNGNGSYDSNTNPVFTWKGTRTGEFINLTHIGFASSEDVDNMLINEAALTTFPTYIDKLIYYHNATHTSASSSAIATLKSNGVTVIENDITL